MKIDSTILEKNTSKISTNFFLKSLKKGQLSIRKLKNKSFLREFSQLAFLRIIKKTKISLS